MGIDSIVPENTCCDMRDSWNIISKLSDEFGVIIHGPSGCENEFFYNASYSHSYSFSTKLNEFDITMGSGYEKLYSKIEYILSSFPKIKVIFVLGTCSSELIGDDIDNVQDIFGDNVKIIVIHTSGMRGAGYHFTKYNVFKHLFGIYAPTNEKTRKKQSINIFFQDGMQNDLFRKEIVSFLSIFGIEVNSFLNSNIGLSELKTINNVSNNYLVGRDEDFVILLDYIKNKHNISYKKLNLPVGYKNINSFFHSIVSDFGVSKNQYIVEFLKFKNKSSVLLESNKLEKYMKDFTFTTNFPLYISLLKDIGITSVASSDFNAYDSVNTSHKFNSGNKIIIGNSTTKVGLASLLRFQSFTTINKFMGFNGVDNFIKDITSQFYYNNFLKKYNKYF